ncbi:MAG: four helix bundle protein [Patescibacteria group bacterium]|jgi:four helix bundle protein
MTKFQEKLKLKMDEYVHFVYLVTKKFPRDELYGVTSQIRRASLSVILNYLEGYARRRPAVQLNFFETSYGSLKESKYLLHFSMKEKYLSIEDYKHAIKLAEEIGAMLWSEIKSLDNKTQKHPKTLTKKHSNTKTLK